MGVQKLFSIPHIKNESYSADQFVSLWQIYVTTFFLTLINPATILDFIALFTSLDIKISKLHDSLVFVEGVFIGSAAWWLCLSLGVVLFRKNISHVMMRVINVIAGCMIIGFGLYALWKGAFL